MVNNTFHRRRCGGGNTTTRMSSSSSSSSSIPSWLISLCLLISIGSCVVISLGGKNNDIHSVGAFVSAFPINHRLQPKRYHHHTANTNFMSIPHRSGVDTLFYHKEKRNLWHRNNNLLTLSLQKGWLASEGDNNDDGDDNYNDYDDDDIEKLRNKDGLVTREMLQRDMLQDPQVKRKRKKKNGGTGYKPLDNRDHLPFAVRQMTPDPYTHPQIKKANRSKVTKTKKSDLDLQLTPSKLYEKKTSSANKRKKKNKNGDTATDNDDDDNDLGTLLGEFKLDKSTTSGDIIVIGEREYLVQKARSQYKYAGGQRFVMVRKVLEVKEVARVQKEEFIMRQYKNSGDDGTAGVGTVSTISNDNASSSSSSSPSSQGGDDFQ